MGGEHIEIRFRFPLLDRSQLGRDARVARRAMVVQGFTRFVLQRTRATAGVGWVRS